MYPTFEEMSEALNQIKEKYDLNEEMNLSCEELLFAIFCNAYKYGKKEISIQPQDIENDISKLKLLLCDCCHMDASLFEKGEEAYSHYLEFLYHRICKQGFGSYKTYSAMIELNLNPHYIERVLKETASFQDIITLGTEFLLQEVPTYYLKKQVLLTLHSKM